MFFQFAKHPGRPYLVPNSLLSPNDDSCIRRISRVPLAQIQFSRWYRLSFPGESAFETRPPPGKILQDKTAGTQIENCVLVIWPEHQRPFEHSHRLGDVSLLLPDHSKVEPRL